MRFGILSEEGKWLSEPSIKIVAVHHTDLPPPVSWIERGFRFHRRCDSVVQGMVSDQVDALTATQQRSCNCTS